MAQEEILTVEAIALHCAYGNLYGNASRQVIYLFIYLLLIYHLFITYLEAIAPHCDHGDLYGSQDIYRNASHRVIYLCITYLTLIYYLFRSYCSTL